MKTLAVVLMGAWMLAAGTAYAGPGDIPGDLRVEQKTGGPLPLKTPFFDENGDRVLLGGYFGAKPVLLTFVYYNCPMLCSLNLKSLAQSLKALDLAPGRDYQLLVVSFDPKDVGGNARAQLAKFTAALGRPSGGGIHFLTGTQASIQALTQAAGFRYARDEDNGLFAHTTALVFATPKGRIAQYAFGLQYPPRDLTLGLLEAKDNKSGFLTRQVLLYCFLYHPQTGRYTLAILNILKLAAFLTVAVLVTLIVLLRGKYQ